jgi:hypothetical protein
MLSTANPDTCAPSMRTVNFLRTNLIYCFEPTLRASLKENMTSFENQFFKRGPDARDDRKKIEMPQRPAKA